MTSDNSPRVYLAGPITGRSKDEATLWRKYLMYRYGDDFGFIDPTGFWNPEGADKGEREQMVLNHFESIRTCDAILAKMSPDTASIGTAMGVVHGHFWGKTIVIIGTSNQHPMIEYYANEIAVDEDGAIKALKERLPRSYYILPSPPDGARITFTGVVDVVHLECNLKFDKGMITSDKVLIDVKDELALQAGEPGGLEWKPVYDALRSIFGEHDLNSERLTQYLETGQIADRKQLEEIEHQKRKALKYRDKRDAALEECAILKGEIERLRRALCAIKAGETTNEGAPANPKLKGLLDKGFQSVYILTAHSFRGQFLDWLGCEDFPIEEAVVEYSGMGAWVKRTQSRQWLSDLFIYVSDNLQHFEDFSDVIKPITKEHISARSGSQVIERLGRLVSGGGGDG